MKKGYHIWYPGPERVKIDIETSESYMCQTGSKIFDEIDIKFIQMEWSSRRINHQKRYQFIIDFFKERQYIPSDNDCKEVEIFQWLNDCPGNIFWIKKLILINENFVKFLFNQIEKIESLLDKIVVINNKLLFDFE